MYQTGTLKGTLMETPNREPQEYSSNRIEFKDPSRYIPTISYYIPTIFLGFPVWGSHESPFDPLQLRGFKTGGFFSVAQGL